jgi:hypothetical protein
MINKDELKYGDTIWQVDINGTDVSLRRIEVGHLHQIAGSYWVSAEQEGSMNGIMLKVDSPYLFHHHSDAVEFLRKMEQSIDALLDKHMEVSE